MYIEHGVNVSDIDMFALLGCYAAHIRTYQRFGTTCHSNFQGSSIREWVTLDVGTDMFSRNVGCYQFTLRNIPEDRRYNWHPCGLHVNHTVPIPFHAFSTTLPRNLQNCFRKFRLAYTRTNSGNWLLRRKQNTRHREPSSDSCLLLYTAVFINYKAKRTSVLRRLYSKV